MFQASNGCRIPTQAEYLEKRRERRDRPQKERMEMRRTIEKIQEQRELDALFNYLQ